MKLSERVNNSVLVAVAASAACMSGISHANTADPTPKQLAQAVKAFLADHGDLCMAKYTWPRDVTPGDEKNDPNDAVQLPVLERLGVVQSAEIRVPKETVAGAMQTSASVPPLPAPFEVTKRYSLTEKGRKYYLQKKHTVIGRHDFVVEHDADFCVAHLTLDKVVKWSPPEPVNGHLQTAVRYTYHATAADWMGDPEAQKLFPVVDRIIRGQGKLLMSATAQLQNGKWVPVMPGQ